MSRDTRIDRRRWLAWSATLVPALLRAGLATAPGAASAAEIAAGSTAGAVGASTNGPTASAALPAPAALGVQPRALAFPADFGSHPDTRTEWWYVTGWLAEPGASRADNAGRTDPGAALRHGFQLTFFRSRSGVAADHPSAFAASQLVFAHAALSDLGAPGGARLHHDQRIARAGFGIASAAVGDSALRLRDWTLQRQSVDAQAPDQASRYRAHLRSESAGFALDLQLATTQPLLRQGDGGYSRKGPKPGQASHYYSQPQLAVQATLTRLGDRTTKASATATAATTVAAHAATTAAAQSTAQAQTLVGRAWLDHEWSNSLLDADAVGWDWVGFNLFDGRALTAFRLRRADGSALWAGGSWREPGQAAARDFGPDALRFTPLARWTSPATGAVYPTDWQLDGPFGRWRVRALFDAQELDSRASTGSVYWEGLSELLDARGQRIGLGYLEMTGYAGRLARL